MSIFMNHVPLTKSLLRSRAREVMAYMRFLRVAVTSQSQISAKSGALTLPLTKDITHTLKANVLLLLYSAMEATIIELLGEMHTTIGDSCTSADDLNQQLFLLVVCHFKRRGIDETEKNTKPPLHRSVFNAWIDDSKQKDSSYRDILGISGNIDGKIIFSCLQRYGVVSGKTPPAHLSDYSLQKVKNHRNILAHGEQSFVDLGQSLSVEELTKDARSIFGTLANIAKEVNSYLADRRYLAMPLQVPEINIQAGNDA
ncbi:MAG: MAE_28990/MAE_18760 family HEPN-like nuclease [Rhodoferax sp.]|nr:MAE_28990/MAE_18760 family HEPN-like nuclease [Rhodoferax sp.]